MQKRVGGKEEKREERREKGRGEGTLLKNVIKTSITYYCYAVLSHSTSTRVYTTSIALSRSMFT